MRDTLLQILMAADLPAALLTAAVLFCLPLRRRRAFFLRAAGGILAALVCFWPALTLIAGAIPGLMDHQLAFVLVYSFLSFVLGVAFVLWCCDLTVWEAVYCATCAYLTQHFTYCFDRLFHLERAVDQPRPLDPLALLLCAGLYAGAYFLFARQLSRDGR